MVESKAMLWMMDPFKDKFQKMKEGRMDSIAEEIKELCRENGGSIRERWFKAYMSRNEGMYKGTLEGYLDDYEEVGEIARKRGKIFYLDDDAGNDSDEQESIETVIERKIGKVLDENGADTFTPAKLLNELDEDVENELGNSRKGREGNLGKKLKEMGYGKYRGRTSEGAVYTVDDEEKRDELKRLARR